MSITFTRLARDRLRRLADTLTTLRERVREAVAGEMGKAVSEAVRDLLTVLLARRVGETPAPPPAEPAAPPPRSRWDDDDDEDEEERWHREPVRPALSPLPDDPTPSPAIAHAKAAHVGLRLTAWLLHRKVPVLAGLGAGLAAGLAALSAHPLVQTGLAVIAAAAELLAITEITPAPL